MSQENGEIGFDEVLAQLKPNELIDSFMDKKSGVGYLAIVDEHGHVRAFFQRKGNKFVEFDIEQMIDAIAEYLQDKVNVKEFLTDVIASQLALDIFDLFMRIHKGTAKVIQKKGCYHLLVYGRRGGPLTLRLRD